jgi:hypothetical protein
MHLTAAQSATLKADILNTPALAALAGTPDGRVEIARLYNLAASPGFTVWKSSVPLGTVGQTFVASELLSRTALENDRLGTFANWNPEGVNPSRADHRAFFDGVFSAAGGAGTRAALLALWKRPATRAEKLFATGTGSDGSPAVLVVEGVLDFSDIDAALNLS